MMLFGPRSEAASCVPFKCSAPPGRPSAERGGLREWQAAALVGLSVLGFCGALLAINGWEWFWNDDFQFLFQPGFHDVARSWYSGEVPLLSPYSWFGGALAGELQFGIFSVPITLLNLALYGLNATPPTYAAVLASTHLAILAMGTYWLGRRRGLPRDLAALAAYVVAFSGYLVIWGAMTWISVLMGFAWLPWFWCGLERALETHRPLSRLLPGALALYCVVTAGWPLSVVMAALLTGWMGLGVWREKRSLWACWPLVAVCALGLGLSAPAWLTFLEYVPESYRNRTPALRRDWFMVVSWRSLPALLFPGYVSRWPLSFFNSPHMHIEWIGATVPTGVVLTCLFSRRGRVAFRQHLWLATFCGGALALCLLPGVGNFRWSFRWMPLFFLPFGLLAAHLLHELRRGVGEPEPVGRPLFGGQGATAALGTLLFVLAVGAWCLYDWAEDTWRTPLYLIALTVLCLGWVLAEARARTSAVCAWAAAAVVFLSSLMFHVGAGAHIIYAHLSWKNLQASLHRGDYSPNIRYLSLYKISMLVHPTKNPEDGSEHLHLGGNLPLLAGVPFVNGYSTTYPAGLVDVFGMGYIGTVDHVKDAPLNLHPQLLLDREAAPGGLLELMGVDGLVVPEHLDEYVEFLYANGWRLEAKTGKCSTFVREQPTAKHAQSLGRIVLLNKREHSVTHFQYRLRTEDPWGLFVPWLAESPAVLDFAPASVTPLTSRRNSVQVEVENPDPNLPALIAFPRPWYPGYRATLNGQKLPVEQLALLVPAVRIPPGAKGVLTLRYLPRSLVSGCYAAGGCLMVSVLLLATRLRRRRPASADAAPDAPRLAA